MKMRRNIFSNNDLLQLTGWVVIMGDAVQHDSDVAYWLGWPRGRRPVYLYLPPKRRKF